MIPTPPPIPIPSITLPTLANINVSLANIPSITKQGFQHFTSNISTSTPEPPSIGGWTVPDIQPTNFDFLSYTAEVVDYIEQCIEYFSDIGEYLRQKDILLRKYAREKEELFVKASARGMYYMPGSSQYDLYWMQGNERREVSDLFSKMLSNRFEKVISLISELQKIYISYYQAYLQSQTTNLDISVKNRLLKYDLLISETSAKLEAMAEYISARIKDIELEYEVKGIEIENSILEAKMKIEEAKESLLRMKYDMSVASKNILDAKARFGPEQLNILSARLDALTGEEKLAASLVYEATNRVLQSSYSAATSLWMIAKETSEINLDKLSLYREQLSMLKELITAERLKYSAELSEHYSKYLDLKVRLENAHEVLSIIKDKLKLIYEEGRANLEAYEARVSDIISRVKEYATEIHIDNVDKYGDSQISVRDREFHTIAEISKRLKGFLADLEVAETRDYANIKTALSAALTDIEANLKLQTKIIHSLGG